MAEQRAICDECGYDLSGLAADELGMVTCPECGRTWALHLLLARPKRPHWSIIVAFMCGPFALVLLTAIMLAALGVLVPTGLSIFLGIVLILSALFVPFLVAGTVSERYLRPRGRFWRAMGLVGVGLGVNVVVYVVVALACYLLR